MRGLRRRWKVAGGESPSRAGPGGGATKIEIRRGRPEIASLDVEEGGGVPVPAWGDERHYG